MLASLSLPNWAGVCALVARAFPLCNWFYQDTKVQFSIDVDVPNKAHDTGGINIKWRWAAGEPDIWRGSMTKEPAITKESSRFSLAATLLSTFSDDADEINGPNRRPSKWSAPPPSPRPPPAAVLKSTRPVRARPCHRDSFSEAGPERVRRVARRENMRNLISEKRDNYQKKNAGGTERGAD